MSPIRVYWLSRNRANAAATVLCLLTFSHAPRLAAGPAPTNKTPMTLTGWNADVVVEQTAVGPPFTSVAAEVNPGNGNAFYRPTFMATRGACRPVAPSSAWWEIRR